MVIPGRSNCSRTIYDLWESLNNEVSGPNLKSFLGVLVSLACSKSYQAGHGGTHLILALVRQVDFREFESLL